MDRSRRKELQKEIEDAQLDEDRAWALAAEARRKQAGDEELVGALRLMEATTARRMKLEKKLKELEPKER